MIHNTHWGPTSFTADWPTNTPAHPISCTLPSNCCHSCFCGNSLEPSCGALIWVNAFVQELSPVKMGRLVKEQPLSGVPEICYWEALKSQELSFSKSKLEHHKSVPSSWALGSAKRQTADFLLSFQETVEQLLNMHSCSSISSAKWRPSHLHFLMLTGHCQDLSCGALAKGFPPTAVC